jgi:hypothetical protein
LLAGVASDLEVHGSAIDGLGVFAGKPFRAGEIVLEIDDSRIVDESHPLAPGDDARHCDYLAAGKVVLMQIPERHINHSCDPNTYVQTVHGKRQVIARCNIGRDEELSYDYCINSSGDTVWNCGCGASRCRRVIHSDFFHLPTELQREYLPLLDDWFREERIAEVKVLEDALSRRYRPAPDGGMLR